jgi:transposase
LAAKKAADEARERARIEEELKEEKLLKEQMERRAKANEAVMAVRARIVSNCHPIFKGGFSSVPILRFNQREQQFQEELLEAKAQAQKQTQVKVQIEKLSSLLSKIDSLDTKIKNEVRALKYSSMPGESNSRRMSLAGDKLRRMSMAAKMAKN